MNQPVETVKRRLQVVGTIRETTDLKHALADDDKGITIMAVRLTPDNKLLLHLTASPDSPVSSVEGASRLLGIMSFCTQNKVTSLECCQVDGTLFPKGSPECP